MFTYSRPCSTNRNAIARTVISWPMKLNACTVTSFSGPYQVPEELWQPMRVMHQLGADVVAVVVMPEGAVVAQLGRVAGRVVRELLDLLDEAGHNHVADERYRRDEKHVDGEDHQRARRPGFIACRIDDRQQGQGKEDADRYEPDDSADPPREVQPDPAGNDDQHEPDNASQ